MTVIAAGAGVHARHEHEARRIFHGIFRSGDGDGAVFDRLAEHFEHLPGKFRELVEEKDTVVGERNLAGHRAYASSYERHGGDGVVGGAEGAFGH